MKNDIRNEIAQRFVRAYRLLYAEGLVQSKKEFCEKTKFLPQNFSAIEQGRVACRLEHLYNLSAVFNVSLDWLFFGEGDFHH